VASMWVAPGHRRTGLGSRLVDAVRLWAESVRANELYLMVTNNNDAAISFYERCGFVYTCRTAPYLNDSALFIYEMMQPLPCRQP
jgi:ribosomal protein S18 acetylase RimI-like enzyme